MPIFFNEKNIKKINVGFLWFESLFEKKINENIKLKQKKLKIAEKKILSRKNKLSDTDYKNKLKLFKSEVFEVQKKYKEDRLLLNNSFQTLQKKLKDLLAQVIKDVSKKRDINGYI